MFPLMLDPTNFNIQQQKEMGIWPPSDIAAHGVLPYIKRLKVDDVIVLDIGVMKGENAVFMLDNDTNNKIKKIYGIEDYDPSIPQEVRDTNQSILKVNIQGQTKIKNNYKQIPVDVLCFNHNSNLEESLVKYWPYLKSNGIICGSEHGLTKVKQALNNFRKTTKIGTPINVSNGSWFWYKR
jgi:hypothetical protein